jgi:hypothetical protein
MAKRRTWIEQLAAAVAVGDRTWAGCVAGSLPGWQWLVGMAGTTISPGDGVVWRYAGHSNRPGMHFIGPAVDGRCGGTIPRVIACGYAPDLWDHPTGCLVHGLLVHGLQRGHVEMVGQTECVIRLIAVPEPLHERLPLGVAAAAIAAYNGGWDRWPEVADG